MSNFYNLASENKSHSSFMQEAIGEALKAKGKTGENPIVGAVIVEGGQIVARGHHKVFGGPHAEVEVIRAYGTKSPEAGGPRQEVQVSAASGFGLGPTLYVTLEPCSTVGKTGKCTDAIIASGIKKVVVGTIDPNPSHQGQGIKILKQARIEVTTGVLAKECADLNPEFNRRMAAEAEGLSPKVRANVSLASGPRADLFDTHCHLYYKDFDADRDEMMNRARAIGIKHFLILGVNLAISKTCLEYAEKYPNVFASAGVHPTEAHKATEDDFSGIEQLLQNPKVVALGEVGLDFYHKDAPQDIQEKVFIRFLEMQKRVQKPLIIHSRDCFDKLLQILRDFGGAPYSGVFHCFTGDRVIMRQCLELGFHISFSGILTYKKNDELRAACTECPSDRILIETDCPYLPPQSHRGKRNEPALMIETAQMAAQVRGIPLEELGRLTTENGLRLFGIKP